MRATETVRADVVVVAATPAGVAAAVAAARSGMKVVVVEESAHVGGIIAGGLTNADIGNPNAIRGPFEEYRRRIRAHYIGAYGVDSPEYRACHDGYLVEPQVAEKTFRDMLASESRITLIERQRVVGATVKDSGGAERPSERGRRIDGKMPDDFGKQTRLTAIRAENLAKPGVYTEFRADVFIDATYEGDLAAIAGASYRVGRESRDTFGEKYAGKVYTHFEEPELLPGSTGEGDGGIQAFCFRFHMTKDKSRWIPVEKPSDYDRDDYRHLVADFKAGKITRIDQVIQFYPMPGGNCEINSNHPDTKLGVPSESLDLAEENWGWPEWDAQQRQKYFKRNWNHNEGLVWFLQHDAVVPKAIRDEALLWGFPTNEFVDNDHRPHHIYVRQGRRIWGEYNFTEKDTWDDPATGLGRRHPDGIAVAEFPVDSHGVTKYDPKHPGVRDGYIFIHHQPTQIPYGVLVPKRVDGLLVPVACSTSHVGYQTIRVEPTFMAIGEAAGIAAFEAIRQRKELRAIDVKPVQKEIINRGGIILFEAGRAVDPFKK
ncbi:hypothetical protein FACS1894159_00610 [Bacteroidia bacterium]|nr:hypothetical protein FACS1894159_00610 [Bacteroidia bacterium]